jgi:hypothetical protein
MDKSPNALLACARWLGFCLKIGWQQADLDRLEALWWEHHDDRGRLLMGPGINPHSAVQ